MLVTAFVAVVGTAVILFNDFNSDAELRTGGKAGAITAAAMSGIRAIEIPSEQPAGPKVSWATQFTNRNPVSLNSRRLKAFSLFRAAQRVVSCRGEK